MSGKQYEIGDEFEFIVMDGKSYKRVVIGNPSQIGDELVYPIRYMDLVGTISEYGVATHSYLEKNYRLTRFEPGYYQRNNTSSFSDSTHAGDVKWFEAQPDLDLWQRVQVLPVDD